MRQRSLPLLLLVLLLPGARRCDRFLLGYITGMDRRPGDRKYERPGRTVSGAISLAVEHANARGGELWARGHALDFVVAETFGEETTSIRRTAELWRRNVTAYIGPQETCVHEARMAAAFNLPMISYFCTHHETSDKAVFPTFARTRPPDTQISKSVASVLLAFNWTQVSFLYLDSAEGEFRTVAATILETLKAAGVRVHFTRTWSEPYHHGYAPNHFANIVADTYLDTRIYVILGYYYEHLGLMAAMEEKKLFDNGEYWVVGVDIEQYAADSPGKYLRDLLRQQEDANATRAFRSYLGVAPSAPRDISNFSQLVSAYIQRPPFNIPNPVSVVGGVRLVR